MLHLSVLLRPTADGPCQVQLVNYLVEKPPALDRRARRAKCRQYARAYRARKKARKMAQAARAGQPDPLRTVSRESQRESVSASARTNPPAEAPQMAQRPSTSPPGNGKALNPTQKKLKERIAALQARVQRRGSS
jgi:hypothetical protein